MPTAAGADHNLAQVIPGLAGRLHSVALRVPVPAGSLTDLACMLDVSATAEDINSAFEEAAAVRPLRDVLGDPRSLRGVSDGNRRPWRPGEGLRLVRNEWAYANRLLELVELVARVR